MSIRILDSDPDSNILEILYPDPDIMNTEQNPKFFIIILCVPELIACFVRGEPLNAWNSNIKVDLFTAIG
jgi:hypothetical protein